MRKGITSGGRTQPVYVWGGLPHSFRKETLGSKEIGDTPGI